MEKFSPVTIKKDAANDRHNDHNTPEMSELPKTDTYGDAPKEWQEFYTTFMRTRKEVLDTLITSGKFDEHYDKIQEKEHASGSSVTNPHEYLAYHLCIGSGTGPIRSPKTDFEGEFALLPFYQKLLAEIKQ